MQYLREGWGQDIAVLPKRGEYRQFADLRGSWRKRGGNVFEGGLILQSTLCVVSMVDTSQSGRLVTSSHMFFSRYNALLVMNSIGYYLFKLHIFFKSPRFPHPKKHIHHFLLVCSLLETCSVVFYYQFIQCTYRPNKLKT